MFTRFFSLLLVFCCCALAVGTLSAQRLHLGGFKLKKVGASIGQDQDMLGDMSASYFLSTARPGDLRNDYSQLDLLPTDTYSMICENPHLRLNATWEHDRVTNLEFGTNLLLITGRIDAMEFRSDQTRNYLYIDQYSNEIAFEPTLGWRMGKGPFHLTAIVGGNVGYHWGNMYINGRADICDDKTVKFRNAGEAVCENRRINDATDITSGISTRVFAEAKASFQLFRRVELGVHLRRGLGVRMADGAATQSTSLHSGGASVAWVLR